MLVSGVEKETVEVLQLLDWERCARAARGLLDIILELLSDSPSCGGHASVLAACSSSWRGVLVEPRHSAYPVAAAS